MDGKMFMIMDDFLQESDVEKCILYVEQKKIQQGIVSDDEFCQYMFATYREKFTEMGIKKLGRHITITNTNRGLKKHTDIVLDKKNRYKILIYLNNVKDGGTIFFVKDKDYLIENRRNRLVLFDASIEHCSQVFDDCLVKKVIGFRPILFF